MFVERVCLPKARRQRSPKIGVFVIETTVLSVRTRRGEQKPEKGPTSFAHASAVEPLRELMRRAWKVLDHPVSSPVAGKAAQPSLGVDGELAPRVKTGLLDPRKHVIEHDVPTRCGARVEPGEQITANAVPGASDLAVEPTLGRSELVIETLPGAATLDEDGVTVSAVGVSFVVTFAAFGQPKSVQHGVLCRPVHAVCMAAEPAAPAGPAALDDGSGQIFGGHHILSPDAGIIVRVVGSRRNRNSGVLFNARLSAR